ncbi:uncharacterized protein LOC116341112 [Contarinia nasturtii]|uniref:uncharacterized protein LOC116341112 n=1 Tax=Contarinia nasturtii TaxID=265458 RepID=UPI0012D3BD6B|nr:uncharacterized protein LOC116341112 [Contarinia nasturtii]
MLATLCGWIEAVVALFVNIFATFYIVGRIITHTLSVTGDALIELAKVIAAFAVSFYEDTTMFMQDIDYHYGAIIKMLNAGIGNSISDISQMGLAISSSITWFGEKTKSETNKMFMGILDLITSSAINIRNCFVLIGNSAWMLLMCVPNFTILIGRIVFTCAFFIWKSIVDTIKLSASVASDSFSVTVTFFTSVPLQSICGLLSMYFIIKYRQYVFRMLKFVYRCMARVIKYLARKITAVIMTVFDFVAILFSPLRNCLPNLWELSSVQGDEGDSSTTNSIKIDAYNFCVICQDKMKSIVLLPCRHLCLCSDCFKQLRRYRKECPMCRKTYDHSIQVYA